MKTCFFYTIISPPDVDKSDGGGAQTGNIIINNLKLCDYDVRVITPYDQFTSPNKGNLNIYFDIFNDPNGSKWFKSHEYEQLLNSTCPFIMADCGYCSVYAGPYGYIRDDIEYANALVNFAKAFFAKAAKVVLASPLHRKQTEKFLNFELNNCYLYPREVDYTHFTKSPLSDEEKDIEYLHVGTFNFYKGTDQVIDLYKDKGLVLAGFGDLPPNDVKYIGKIEYKDLPHLYHRAKRFVHLPRWKETFSRTVCEASLCGCKIIGNDNIGALSYENLDLSDPQTYIDSQLNFIKMIVEQGS